MNSIAKMYRALSQKERTQVIVLAACILISSYMIIAVLMFDKMFTVEKLSNRKQNRIETRIGKFEIPEIQSGLTQKALDKANAALAKQETLLMQYKNSMLPMDTPKPREQVKLKITHLAQQHNIDIVQLDTSGTEIRETPQELTGKALKALFSQRTSFSIKASAEYFDFIAFVESLSSLPYINYIKNLQISSVSGNSGENSDQSSDGLLNITFDLQM